MFQNIVSVNTVQDTEIDVDGKLGKYTITAEVIGSCKINVRGQTTKGIVTTFTEEVKDRKSGATFLSKREG